MGWGEVNPHFRVCLEAVLTVPSNRDTQAPEMSRLLLIALNDISYILNFTSLLAQVLTEITVHGTDPKQNVIA